MPLLWGPVLIVCLLTAPSGRAQELGAEGAALGGQAQLKVMKALEQRRLHIEMREEQVSAFNEEATKLQEEMLKRLGELEVKTQEYTQLKMEVDKIKDIEAFILEARAKFDAHLLDIAEGRAEEVQQEIKTQRLSKVVSQMRPDEAAMLLEKMDRPLVAQILSTMSERKMAKIMEAMSPDISSKLGKMVTQ